MARRRKERQNFFALTEDDKSLLKQESKSLLNTINDIYDNIEELKIRDIFFLNYREFGGRYIIDQKDIDNELISRKINPDFFFKNINRFDMVFLYSYKGVDLENVYTTFNTDSRVTFYMSEEKNGFRLRAYDFINFINNKNNFVDSSAISIHVNKEISPQFKKVIKNIVMEKTSNLSEKVDKISPVEIDYEEEDSINTFLLDLQKELINSKDFIIPLKHELKERLELLQITRDQIDFVNLLPRFSKIDNKIKVKLS